MKFIRVLVLILISGSLMAQIPQSFKYQAVIRNSTGAVLVNQIVSLRISILQDSPLGNMVYIETHQIATNEYGIANINIGEGIVVTGVFKDITWGTTTHFVKTELDITGNEQYEFIGTSQLLSVPYALYAEMSGNAEDDFDKDSTNEIQDLKLNGNILTITKNGTANQIDLSGYLDNTDEQELQLNGNEIIITNGNSVILPPDNDGDTLNEIQTLSKTDSLITLSKNGGTVIDSDNQVLSLNGNTLTISNGNSLILAGAVDLDSDPTNEIQSLSISKDTIYLSGGGSVVIPEDYDPDSTNEIQSLILENDTLSIDLANYVVFPYDSALWSINGNEIYYNSGGVGIGTTDPNDNAILELSSTTQGFLPPRMTRIERDLLTNVPIGLQIYNTTSNCIDYWNGINWNELCGDCTPVPTVADANINGGDIEYYGVSTFITMQLQANTPIEGNGMWELISNPDTAGIIDNPSDPNSNFSGNENITYALRWSIGTICDTTTDTILITFHVFESAQYQGTMYLYPIDPLYLEWGGYGIATGATDPNNGAQNTTTIVSVLGNNGGVDYAAKFCNDLDAYGYNDWYLPSKNELDIIDYPSNLLTLYNYYWSSTESDADQAWKLFTKIQYSTFSTSPKQQVERFRCIRR